MNESLARQALEKIQKQATIIDELRDRCARLEALLGAAGISKSAQRMAATESLGTTAARVLKGASAPKRTSNTWTPKGALSRLEKGAKPIEKATGEGVLAERIADIRERS
jgi:hypothetical protein